MDVGCQECCGAAYSGLGWHQHYSSSVRQNRRSHQKFNFRQHDFAGIKTKFSERSITQSFKRYFKISTDRVFLISIFMNFRNRRKFETYSLCRFLWSRSQCHCRLRLSRRSVGRFVPAHLQCWVIRLAPAHLQYLLISTPLACTPAGWLYNSVFQCWRTKFGIWTRNFLEGKLWSLNLELNIF